jgi:antitoxin component of MazEF toxin-antitoxin module
MKALKLFEIGNSLAFIVPMAWHRDLGWQKGHIVVASYDRDNQTITLRSVTNGPRFKHEAPNATRLEPDPSTTG